jgi:nucleotide-binding universal stress UspA family protein
VYKTIVVGTDGSPSAGLAVSHAADLAALAGATLHLVHAYRPVSGLANLPDVAPMLDIATLNKMNEEEGARICERAASAVERDGLKLQRHAVPGDPAEALIEVAEAEGADLLVVGNRGMAGARRFVLGSVPNKVSHHCPCSLLVVRTT